MAASAEIQRYDRNRDGYVEYFIKVVHNGREWSIKKRYKEFATLHEFLLKNEMEIPYPLPAKYAFRRHDEKMLRLRRKELQSYLDGLLKCHPLNSNRFLREFLEVEMGLLGIARKLPKMSLQVMNVLENLKTVSEDFDHAVIDFKSLRGRSFSQKSFSTPPSPIRPSLYQQQPYGGPSTLRKSKSLSFSTRSVGKLMVPRESFMGDNNDKATTPSSSGGGRKASVDFMLSGEKGSGNNGLSDKMTAKKKAFLAATDAIWSHYIDDVDRRCRHLDYYTFIPEECCEITALSSEDASLWQAAETAIVPFFSDPNQELKASFPMEKVIFSKFTIIGSQSDAMS
eukprot:gene5564-6126_t